MPIVSWDLEIDVEAAASMPRIVPICRSYQARVSVDTTHTAWVRNELGRADVSELDLSVVVYAYGRTTELATLEATGTVDGQVDFIVPATITATRLQPGLYRISIRASDGTTTVLAHAGILEIV